MTKNVTLMLVTGLILAAGCLLLVHKLENSSNEVSLIKDGMSPSEVRLHLGDPDYKETITKKSKNWTGQASSTPYSWDQMKIGDSVIYWVYYYEGEGYILLTFDPKSSTVIHSEFIIQTSGPPGSPPLDRV